MTEIEWDIFQAEPAVRALLDVNDLDTFHAWLANLFGISGKRGMLSMMVEVTVKTTNHGVATRWICGGYLPLSSGLYFMRASSSEGLKALLAKAVANAEKKE